MKISAIVKKIGYLHSTSTETPTSFELAKEIVNKLSVDWSNPDLKILDPACGRGTFLLAVAEKLQQSGHSRKHIVNNMLYGVDISKVQTMITARALTMFYNGSINITTENTLEKIWNMKFDVIVGNPPYQAPKKGDYSFWARFVDGGYKLLNDDGYMSMIIPAGWMSPTNDIRQGQRSVMRDIFAKENTSYINIDPDLGKKHFPGIGQKFTWFVLEKGQYSSTKIDFGNSIIDVDLSSISMLAKDTDSVNIGILAKLSANPVKWDFTRYIMKESWNEVTFDPLPNHLPRINGNSNHLDKIVYSTNKCKYHDNKKVVLPYNGSDYKFVVDDSSMGCTNAYVMILSKLDLIDSAVTYFTHPLLQWLGKNKFTQYNEGALINSVSKIDLTKVITTEDVYKLYNLTPEEIEYVEASVK
jgi:site-specific DNA-methyltransferase (adenine-specific)